MEINVARDVPAVSISSAFQRSPGYNSLDEPSDEATVIGTNANEFVTSNLAGRWREDPISLIPVALGSHWHECKPFAIQSADQFRAPPPPLLGCVARWVHVHLREAGVLSPGSLSPFPFNDMQTDAGKSDGDLTVLLRRLVGGP